MVGVDFVAGIKVRGVVRDAVSLQARNGLVGAGRCPFGHRATVRDLHVAESWYRTTALEDLLGVSTEDIYDERLYRALDRILPQKEAL